MSAQNVPVQANVVAGRVVLARPMSLQQMDDGIVSKNVFSSYCNGIIHFINWCAVQNVDETSELLTELAKETVKDCRDPNEGESKKKHRARVKAVYMNLIRNARNSPLVIEENITPGLVMKYIASGANQQTGKALSRSSYKGKRSAIFHLLRCHNGRGPTEEYKQRIGNYWKGFGRKRSNRSPQNEDENEDGNGDSSDDEEDDRDELNEGKEAISTELYRSILKWLLEYASVDSLLAACFICLTWNLACRSNNTAKLKLSHLSWTKFDAMQINFKHTKTDVTGAEKQVKRNLYSNINEPDIDFTFLLGLYLATNFTTVQEAGYRLFPGTSDSTTKRVSRKLQEVLELHEDEVIAMGYASISDIGLHSLRKGAATYLGSLPGGPSPVAICHRCGWSTGKVLDIYFQQLQRGDEFVGRCLSLLNLMSSDFASSPAYFCPEVVDNEWMANCVKKVFPCFHHINGMQKILQRCLASMIHHHDYVARFEANHPARKSIAIFRDYNLMEHGLAALKTHKAWDTTNHISGVPPHVKELVDLAEIKDQLGSIAERIFEKVMKGVTDYFETRRIGGGELTEERLMELIQRASDSTRSEVFDRLTLQLERLVESFQQNPLRGMYVEEPTNGNAFSSTELPIDFEFPRSNTLDLWVQWNTPNREQNIPALKNVSTKSYKFLDEKQRSAGECNRSSRLQANRKGKRRESRRTASDMKILCQFIEAEARKFGFETISELNMQEAFETVAKEFGFGQEAWTTTLKAVQKLKNARKNAPAVEAEEDHN
ncbi:hypothetical protein FisN_14Lu064, partial [Fistulifera solaris]